MIIKLKHQLVYDIILTILKGGLIMGYSSWNLKKAKQQKEFLIQNNENGKYDVDIDLINRIIDGTVTPFDVSLSLKEKLEFDKEKIDEYDSFIKPIEEFHHLTKKVKSGYLWEINLPINELLTFVNDFFHDALPEWYHLFLEVYKEKNNNFQIANKRCFELYIPGVNYSYISYERKLTIEDLFSIVHEYTHAIVDRIKYRYSYDNNYPFVELPSITAELIAKDIIKAYYTNVNEEIKNYFIGFIASLNEYAKNILLAKKFLDTYSLDDEEQIEYNLKHFAKSSKRNSSSFTDKLQLENICYVVPFIYAVELYYIYLSDTELFQYDMNKIITMDNCSNYFNEVKKLGLVANQNTNKFIQNIKRG